MKPPTALLLAALVATPAMAQAPGASPIRPGYWESTSEVVSPIPTSKTEKRCIRAEDVDKFIGGAPNRHYTCTYPTRVVADGKIRLEGSCKTKNSDPVPVSGEGVFTPDSLQMDARIDAKIAGVTIPIRARTTAKRIGDVCPAPDAPEPPGA